MAFHLKSKLLLALSGTVVFSAAIMAEPPHRESHSSDPRKVASNSARITISKDTTFITEPLTKDGYPDYIAALNRVASSGITLQNNAAVVFWKAMGPNEIWEEHREKYFQMLGMTLPKNGSYFVHMDEYVRRCRSAQALTDGQVKDRVRGLEAQLDIAVDHPWSRQDLPTLAHWIAENEKPLALVIEASQRPRRYDPFIQGKYTGVLAVPLPATTEYRIAMKTLVARAMLRLYEDKVTEAWQDILACHRLARLIGQSLISIEANSHNSDGLACHADEVLLRHAKLTAPLVAKMRDDIDKLPPVPVPLAKLNIGERFIQLDLLCSSAKKGSASFRDFKNVFPKAPIQSLDKILGDVNFNWDYILRMNNHWFDLAVEVLQKPGWDERWSAVDKFMDEIEKMERIAGGAQFLQSPQGNLQLSISERYSQMFIASFPPNLLACSHLEARMKTRFNLVKLAFALAAYHIDHGTYPEKLEDIKPKYMAEIPKDVFTGNMLRYERNQVGYLLYSAGPTMSHLENRKVGSDLLIEMPGKGGH